MHRINWKRMTAFGLAGILASGSLGMDVQAKAPEVKMDESVYINMDYYGKPSEVSIVKGCALNGNTQITDYGNYSDVINMSNSAVPVMENGKVTWNLEGQKEDTFYFEGKTDKLATELPWTFDIGYKLNGKEVKGEDLAGANGLITTQIDVKPNKKAPDYYKNNMILTISTIVDMEDNYSVEAPGSQIQTVGTKKTVIFMALPGEEGTFRIDVGTNSYESLGMFMMMVPATLSSLDRISDIREVKDKVRDSLDAMSDGADVILDNFSAMKDDLEETKKGMQSAKEAKATVDAEEDQVKADMDAAINSLDNMSASLTLLSQQTTVEKGDLTDAAARLDDMRKSIYDMQDYLEDMEDASKDLQNSLKSLRKTMDSADEAEDKAENYAQMLDAVGTDGEKLNGALTGVLLEFSSKLTKAAKNPLNDTSAMIHEVENLTAKTREVINEGYTLGGKMTQEYKDNLLLLMDDTQALIDSLNVSVLATQKAMRSIRSLTDATEDSLDQAIDSSLNGMIGILDDGIGMAGGSEVLRDAKNTMKKAVDDELDEIEDDTNILNIDTEEKFPSFTSAKNSTPSSIQIIMRTEEINIDDNQDNTVDLEKEPADIGVWGRIKNVFARMFGWMFK